MHINCHIPIQLDSRNMPLIILLSSKIKTYAWSTITNLIRFPWDIPFQNSWSSNVEEILNGIIKVEFISEFEQCQFTERIYIAKV